MNFKRYGNKSNDDLQNNSVLLCTIWTSSFIFLLHVTTNVRWTATRLSVDEEIVFYIEDEGAIIPQAADCTVP